jgi:glycerol-3-phosphate O-acyltransferase
MLWLKVRGRFMRFGYAAVGFGKPLPLSEIVATGSGDVTERMAEVIMRRVRAAMPVLPVPLVAAVLLDGGETTTSALVERAKAILATMRAKGRSPHLPSGTVEAAVAAGLSTLTVRRIVAEVDGVHVSRPDDINLLHYYAASLLLDDYADAAAESYPAESLAT